MYGEVLVVLEVLLVYGEVLVVTRGITCVWEKWWLC